MAKRKPHSAETRARMSEARKRAWADPEVRARMSEGRKRAWAGCRRSIVCPKWVPDDLKSEFFEVAGYAGEEAAASHVRRLKREALAHG